MWQQLKQLGKHSAIYGLGNIATSILSFLLVPLYTHTLSPADFGVYSLLTTAFSLLSVLVDLGFTNSLARAYFEELPDASPEARQRYNRTLLSTAVMLGGAFSLFMALSLWTLAPWIANTLLHHAAYLPFIHILAVALVFRGLTAAPLVYLRVTGRPLVFALLTSAQLIAFLVLNIVFLVHLHQGVSGILLGLLISTAFYAVCLLMSVGRDLKMNFGRDIALELARFGLPFLPVLLMMWVIDLSDRYLLGQYTTLSEVGIYSLGYKFGQCMTFVVTAFTLSWAPLRYKVLELEDPQVVFGRVATFYLAGAGGVWLLLSLWSHEVIALTSPPQFARAAIFIAPVAMAYLIYGLFVLAVTGQGVTKKANTLPFIAVGAAILNIALNIAFIPRVGSIASAYATIAAYAALTLGSLAASQKLYHIPYEYRKMVFIFASMLGLLAVNEGLTALFPPPPFALSLLIKVVLLCLYWVLVILSGLLRRDESAKLLRLLSRFSPSPLRVRLSRAANNLQPPIPGESPS